MKLSPQTFLLFLLLCLFGFSSLFSAQVAAPKIVLSPPGEMVLIPIPASDSLDQKTEALLRKQVNQGFVASLVASGFLSVATVAFLVSSLCSVVFSLGAVLMLLGTSLAVIGWLRCQPGLKKLRGKRNKPYRQKARFSFVFGSLLLLGFAAYTMIEGLWPT